METWRTEMNSSMKEMARSQQELLLEVRQRPTRPEIETMLLTKVSLETFNLELKGVKDDIESIRKQPENTRAWVGTWVAIGGCLMTIASVILSTGLTLLSLFLSHWHP